MFAVYFGHMKIPTRRVLVLTAGVVLLAGLAASQKNNTPEAMLRAAMDKETVDGDLKAAIEQYKKVIAQKGAGHEVVAKALVRLGEAYEKQGSAEARPAYERVVREFADQTEAVQEARARLAASPSTPRGKSLRQVCAGADCDGWISPDGRYLSLTKDGNIFVRDLTNGQIRQVTHVAAPTRAAAPRWAPDSKRIAYFTAEPSSARLVNRQTVIVNVDGSGTRTVYRGGDAYGWSFDGKRVLVAEFPGDQGRLLWVAVADGAVQALPISHFSLDWAEVSPDGRYVAFNASKDKDSEENVYVVASDGSGETIVSANAAYQEPVGWTSDGKYLLYAQYAGQVSLWAVPISGGKPGIPLLAHRGSGSDSLAYRGITRSGALYYRVVTNTWDIFTASMDPGTGKLTSAPVQLPLSRSGNNQGSHWSPDGRRIVHQWMLGTSPIDTAEIWVYSLDTGKEQRVASNTVAIRRGVYWGADGESLVFNTPRALATNTNQSEPTRFNLRTGEATKLFPGAASFSMDSFSASAGLVADWDPTGMSIKVRNLRTGAETEVHKYSRRQVTVFSPYLSHDGRWLAFRETLEDGTAGLFVVSTEGGTARELVRVKSSDQFGFVRGVAWSPDDRFVYFQRRPDPDAPFDLLRVPASGGTEENTGLRRSSGIDLDIAPDGKRIAFTSQTGQQSEIWAMENFLPLTK